MRISTRKNIIQDTMNYEHKKGEKELSLSYPYGTFRLVEGSKF